MRPHSILAALAAVVALGPLLTVACTSDTVTRIVIASDGGDVVPSDAAPSDGGTEGDAAGTSKAGIALSVVRVDAASKLGGRTAGEGRELALVAIKLANVGSEEPISAAFPLFSLSTADAVVSPPEVAATTALSRACRQDIALERGGVLECTLAFEIKQGAAKDLRYRTPKGDVLVVTVPPVTRCHALAQSGKPVTATKSTESPPPLTPPPQGTFLLASATTTTGTGTFSAQTIRIYGTTFEAIYSSADGYVVQETATFTAPAFGSEPTKLTSTCTSPYDEDDPASEDARLSYNAATSTLIRYYGRGETILTYRKK